MNTPLSVLNVAQQAHAARRASRILAFLPTATKNAVLSTLAELLESHATDVLSANAADLTVAREQGLTGPKLHRLALTAQSVAQLSQSLRQLINLPDPVGMITKDAILNSGLHVRKVRAPLGVIAMIYESRPGVTVDAFALCLKAGNACILKGGKEAERSNAALAQLAKQALAAHGVPGDAIVNLSGTPRETTRELLTLSSDIDLVIPRGGVDLIRFVHEHSRIPTIQHFHGVCHVFVDKSANLDMAEEICATGKASAPATCNSTECVLVHEAIAASFIPRMVERFTRDGVEVRASARAIAFCGNSKNIRLAVPADFGTEFLDLIVAIDVVSDIDAAIDHIDRFGSNHTEAIITEDREPGGAAEKFGQRIQSSCVLVNASTRFNDGFQLGLGAEIGISTSRIHAYGPMGLEELTTQRWIVDGNGQTR